MAIPTVPIEVWALSDYVLPNTGQLNKQRPIDDLWEKGYDKGQKPSAETWNYLFNMLARWIKYIYDEQIPALDGHFLKISSNLSDVANVATARTNLGVYSKTEADNKFVDVTGDTMTGQLTLPRLNFVASSTDLAYITTTTPTADTTYFDFVVGDNVGSPVTGITDSMRFRFAPTGGSLFTMVELNAISNTVALMNVTGNINASGTLNAAGQITGGSLVTAGLMQSGNLNVISNSATVGGRNIVRSVNGNTADAAGNVTITLPSAGVQDMRFGGVTDFRERAGTERMSGGVMTTWADFGSSNYHIYLRPLQFLRDGIWITVPYS